MCQRRDEEVWLFGVVTGHCDRSVFILPLREEYSAICHHSSNKEPLQLGDSVRCRVIRKKHVKEEYRSKHVVIDYEKCPSFAPYRVVCGVVLLTIEATVDDWSSNNGKDLLLLHSDMFGTVVDLDGRIRFNTPIGTVLRIEVKSVPSPRDRNASIYIIADVFDRRETTNRRKASGQWDENKSASNVGDTAKQTKTRTRIVESSSSEASIESDKEEKGVYSDDEYEARRQQLVQQKARDSPISEFDSRPITPVIEEKLVKVDNIVSSKVYQDDANPPITATIGPTTSVMAQPVKISPELHQQKMSCSRFYVPQKNSSKTLSQFPSSVSSFNESQGQDRRSESDNEINQRREDLSIISYRSRREYKEKDRNYANDHLIPSSQNLNMTFTIESTDRQPVLETQRDHNQWMSPSSTVSTADFDEDETTKLAQVEKDKEGEFYFLLYKLYDDTNIRNLIRIRHRRVYDEMKNIFNN